MAAAKFSFGPWRALGRGRHREDLSLESGTALRLDSTRPHGRTLKGGSSTRSTPSCISRLPACEYCVGAGFNPLIEWNLRQGNELCVRGLSEARCSRTTPCCGTNTINLLLSRAGIHFLRDSGNWPLNYVMHISNAGLERRNPGSHPTGASGHWEVLQPGSRSGTLINSILDEIAVYFMGINLARGGIYSPLFVNADVPRLQRY